MQLQQVGDSVLFTPALRALRARYPDARIDLLVNNVSRHFYAKCPYVQAIHVAPSWRAGPRGTRLWPMLPVLRRLRKERYDCVVACITQQSFKYALIAWLTGAPLRVGFNPEGRGFLHSLQLPVDLDRSFVDQNLDIVRALGGAADDAREEAYFDQADEKAVFRLLEESGVGGEGPLVVLHVAVNWQSRTWFSDRWAQLISELRRTTRARIVLVGTESEREYVEGIMKLPGAEGAVSLLGRTSIAELAALLHMARLFVGTDSGPRHIAGALGRPHVTLMSAQDDTSWWIGFRSNEIVLRTLPSCHGCFAEECSHRTCMRDIAVSDVLLACQRALDGDEGHPSEPWLWNPREQPVPLARASDVSGGGRRSASDLDSAVSTSVSLG